MKTEDKAITWVGMKKLLVFVLAVDLLLILGALELKAGFRAADASQKMLEKALASRYCRKGKTKAMVEDMCGAMPASWHFLPFRTRCLHHAYVRCLEGYVSHRETKLMAKTQLLVGLFPLLVASLLFLVLVVFLRPLYESPPSPSTASSPSFSYPRFARRKRSTYRTETTVVRPTYARKKESIPTESSSEH